MLNNVSFEQGLQTIGVAHTSWLRPVISIVALAFLGAMFVSDRESDRGPTLARRALLLMGAMGFVAGSWLNYYAVVPLLLLPFYARRHRVAVAALAGGFALAFLLPEFDARVLKTQPALRLLKLLPYWIAPAWMVATELRQIPWSPRVKRLAMVAGVAVAVLITIEAGRNVVSRSNERQAEALLASGQTARAAEKYQSAIQLTPEDGTLRMSGAVALMLAGESRAARAQFGRAVELSPDDAVIRDNFGRMLMMERNWSEAAAQLEIARRLEPGDSEVLASLAQARWALGEREEAVKLLLRAREIDPGNRNVQEALLAIERDAKRAGAK
jgi:Tfp pilus assembly protein PilF